MNKNISITGITVIFLFSAFFISAQNIEPRKLGEPYKLEQTREGGKIKSKEADIKAQNLREKGQIEMKQKREIMEQRKLDMEKKRMDFKRKISEIKDSKKKEMADKIMNQINRVNQVWTNHFTNVLNRLDTVLQKVKSRVAKLPADRDLSALNSAISKAESAISLARSQVLEQSQKSYIVNTSTITNETSINSGQDDLVNAFRSRFKLLKDKLMSDLFSLRDGAVKDARNAVQEAFMALSKIPNVDRESVENLNNQ